MEELAEPNPPIVDSDEKDLVPRVDMEFASDEEAYQLYNNYAKVVGFSVRKAWVNRRASGVIISRTYVCYKEGYQGNKRDENEVKKPRQNERTGCLAHMTVKITITSRYRVSEFHPMHNHDLVPPAESLNLKSHRVAKRSQAAAAKYAQKPNFEYLVRQVGGYRQIALVSVEDAADENWAPKVDLEFENDENAYRFYNDYAKRIGFDVRKAWVNRRASGVILSRTYVCYKQGYYCNKRDGSQVEKRRLRPNERTGCYAQMIVKLAKNGKYRVTEFEPVHNHELVTARTAHTLKTYRAANKSRNIEVESAGFFNGAQVDNNGHANSQYSAHGGLRYSCARQRDVRKPGDVGALMEYMQERQVNDPTFYYAVQLDSEDQIMNIFWTDGKSVADYCYFGDVVCFDTTYKANNYAKPLAPFYGVSHHKQIVIFGSALLYDETEESFKWLFKTFESAMYGKQPKIILTEQNSAMINAVVSKWSGTAHRLCVWHMYHSAVKHLGQVFQGSRTFAHDFSICLFDCENVEKFVTEWKAVLKKYDLKDNKWLNKLFEDRERWAVAYGRETFTADMRSTQRMTNLDALLKEHLNSAANMLQFLERYERLVDELRDVELKTDFHATQCVSVTAPRMLNQAANLYTPAVFDMFQREFEMSMDCMVFNCGMNETVYEYKVSNEENPEEHLVRYNPSDGTLACSCKKFEFVGIQCRHVLKTLDINNIKELPLRYFLKRWRKDARIGLVREVCGELPETNPNISKAKRFSSLCHLFSIIAARAAETVEGHVFLENQSQKLLNHVYQIPPTTPLEEPELS